MMHRIPSPWLIPAAMGLALGLSPACGKSRQDKPREDKPVTQEAPRPMGPSTPRARMVHSPRKGPALTVPKRPPGAPKTGELLAFAQPDPTLFDWRKTALWSKLAHSDIRPPGKIRKVSAQILKQGWKAAAKAPETRALVMHLAEQARILELAGKLPPCAPLRGSWLQTKLIQQHRSLFPLKNLGEGLLLSARHLQHLKRASPALDKALAALRLSCHLAQIPEVILQLMALKLEAQALLVVAAQPVDRARCQRRMQALVQHATRRPRLDHVARADWLMARSQLHLITRDLTRLGRGRANQQARKRLATLKQLIEGRASALYGRYSQLIRQGLATGRLADWETLDHHLLEHKAALEGLQKKYGVKSGADLSWVVARFPDKHPSWTADVIARSFLGLITMRSTIWRRARELHRENSRALARLRLKSCSTR